MKISDGSTTSSTSAPSSDLEEFDRLLAEAIEAQRIATEKREKVEAIARKIGRPMPLFDRLTDKH